MKKILLLIFLFITFNIIGYSQCNKGVIIKKDSTVNFKTDCDIVIKSTIDEAKMIANLDNCKRKLEKNTKEIEKEINKNKETRDSIINAYNEVIGMNNDINSLLENTLDSTMEGYTSCMNNVIILDKKLKRQRKLNKVKTKLLTAQSTALIILIIVVLI